MTSCARPPSRQKKTGLRFKGSAPPRDPKGSNRLTRSMSGPRKTGVCEGDAQPVSEKTGGEDGPGTRLEKPDRPQVQATCAGGDVFFHRG